MNTTITPLIFYLTFFCQSCHKNFGYPIEKKPEDIPEEVRETIVKKVQDGAKLVWNSDPHEDEVAKMEAELVCPHCHNKQARYVWRIAC
jgi:hypothetical protein